jgi:phage terminase large subunit-like protein
MAKSKNPRLKKAFIKTEYTPEMIQELTRCARDPIYFIENYVYIKGTKGRALFKLHPYQKTMILNYLNFNRSISLVARQGGKSETASAFITWFYCFHEEKTILITSYRGENSKEIIQKIQYAYEELPDWIKPGVDENNWNKLSVAFENKCRVIADTTSDNTGRGFTIDLLYVDELAFVKDTIADSFYGSVLPTLASRVDGNMIITSTPNGDTNLFARLWKGAVAGINGFETIPCEMG